MPLLLFSLALAWTDGECATCHPDVAARFATSRHARSFTNANFAAAWEDAVNRAWCASCHLPRGKQVSCSSCHDDHEPVRHDVCADCHTVPSPNVSPPLRFGGDALQTTWAEWKQLEIGPCADCHLDGHAFVGAHDVDLVRSALKVVPERGAITLKTTDALGHRLPTGDPFRRLSIELCTDPDCTEVVTRRTLGVVHQPDESGWMRVRTDTRLGPPGSPWPAEVTVRDPRAQAYRVRLLLADPALTLPVEERVLELYAGLLPSTEPP